MLDAYLTRWLPASMVEFDWVGGDVDNCRAGTPVVAVQNAAMEAIDYVRAQAGLPPVSENPASSSMAQQAALMMDANDALSHYPPETWRCYTPSGAEGARRSNLALGTTGVNAVGLFMNDPGANNGSVGHRTWLLEPGLRTVGIGQTPQSQAIHVVGADLVMTPGRHIGPPITWPTAGYFPRPLVPRSGRWSFDAYDDPTFDFDLRTATVSVTRRDVSGDTPVPTLVESIGADSVVFNVAPSEVPASSKHDVTYAVTISGATRVSTGAAAPDLSYTVTLVSPEDEDEEPAPPAVEFTELPWLLGTPDVGEELFLVYQYDATAPLREHHIEWLRDGLPIPGSGADHDSGHDVFHDITAADLGSRLAARVTLVAEDGTSISATTPELAPVRPGIPPTAAGSPTVAGRPKVGRTLKVLAPTWVPSPTRVTFQWLRGTRAVPGATGSRYRLTRRDLGKLISVRLTASLEGHQPGTATSPPRGPVTGRRG
ncbi:CAP domain-containing protein [Nocardioides ferulae]|uniref:CAP domain-containing protein n=1 Tax=Nocardioides ferulae TaxID=2340821 RepID=UPI0013DE0F46|nr:CAP domain-containing protein [Nocardioides ferulae]